MAKKVDVRGLSCPQPVMFVKKAIDAGENDIIVTAIDATAEENVKRLAKNDCYSVEVENKGSVTLPKLKK